MNGETPIDELAAIALLGEPRRRALYEYVSGSGRAVGRDEAARAVGVSRELAAFHLDRLAGAGLLEVEYRRLGGRSGPGAGRPSKLYRRTDREVSISLPARNYVAAAEVFADALSRQPGSAGADAVSEIARAHGRRAGAEARAAAGPRASAPALRAAFLGLLRETGYGPQIDPDSGEIHLQNCPYRSLAQSRTDLTCGMNLAWAEGVAAGLSEAGLKPRLDPAPGRCCVVFVDAKRAAR